MRGGGMGGGGVSAQHSLEVRGHVHRARPAQAAAKYPALSTAAGVSKLPTDVMIGVVVAAGVCGGGGKGGGEASTLPIPRARDVGTLRNAKSLPKLQRVQEGLMTSEASAAVPDGTTPFVRPARVYAWPPTVQPLYTPDWGALVGQRSPLFGSRGVCTRPAPCGTAKEGFARPLNSPPPAQPHSTATLCARRVCGMRRMMGMWPPLERPWPRVPTSTA